MPLSDDPRSEIESFRVGEGIESFYTHYIYPSTDDRIECLNYKGQLVLTYTASSAVFDKDGKLIGNFNMRGNSWVFNAVGGAPLWFGRDLLKAEVEISKRYIKGELS